MATFTQDKPLARKTFIFEGESYDVVRGDRYPYGRKYSLRRTGVPGKPDACVYVAEHDDDDAMMANAANRLLGVS